jgi:hypothetical protein
VGPEGVLNLGSSGLYLGCLYKNGLAISCGEAFGEIIWFVAETGRSYPGDFDGLAVPEVGGTTAATKVNREYADVMDGVPRPLAAFPLSYSLIHDSSGLVSVGPGVGERFVLSNLSISRAASRGVRSLKPVKLSALLGGVGVLPAVPYFLFQLDISG